MKKVHRYSGQALNESITTPGRGVYWYMAPCGQTVTVRARWRDVESGAIEDKLRHEWRTAPESAKCSRCKKY